MRSVFDHHISSAFFADHIGHFIFDLDAFQFLFRNLDRLVQIRIEIADDFFPCNFSLLDHIKKSLHVRCKIHIHNTRERLFHDIVHNLADLRHIQILSLFCNIPARQNRGDRRRVRTRTSDSQFLQCLYKRCLGIMCRRLCKMLFFFQCFFRQHRVHAQTVDQHIALFFFLVRFGINRTESLERHAGRRHRKQIISRRDLHGSRLKSCRLHPACRKPFPDQLVQPELVSRQRVFKSRRCSCNIRRTDRLVGILDLLLGLFLRTSCRYIIAAIRLRNISSCRSICFLRNTCGIRTQIGDDTDRSVAFDIHTLV